MGYSKEEQETSLVFDYSTGIWSVYSTVPKHIRKLSNLTELNVIKSEDGKPIAVKGELTEKQVSMRKLRILSNEEKEKARERGKLLGKQSKRL